MAFCFQDATQRAKLGAKKCPWSVCWTDSRGVRHSKKVGPKSYAQKFKVQKEHDAAAGLCETESRITWTEFRQRYEEHRSRKRASTLESDQTAFNHFERLIRPGKLSAIGTATIEHYVALRSRESVRGGRTAAPATINRELRSLRAALRRAVRWELIPKAPMFEMLKVDRPRPQIMPDEDFAKLYRHTSEARRPGNLSIPAAEWWQALLIFGRYTGWRIGEILSLRWADLDQDEAGQWWATTEAANNKGGRTERVPLIAVVVDHLERIRTFDRFVFPWAYSRRTLYPELERIADAAKVTFPSNGRRRDVFHVFRKTYATRAAMAGIDQKALAGLMRHTDIGVTQKYYLDAEALMGQAVGKIEVAAAIREAVG